MDWLTFWGLKKLTEKDEAVQVLRVAGIVFYCAATLNIILTLLEKKAVLAHIQDICTLLFVFYTGYGIRNLQSRVAAILSLCIIAFGFVLSPHFSGVINMMINLSMLFATIASLRASFAFHKIVMSRIVLGNLVAKAIWSLIYGLLLFPVIGVSITWIFTGPMKTGPTNQPIFDAIGGGVVGLGVFLTCIGWLPFTKNKPLCVIPEDTETTQ